MAAKRFLNAINAELKRSKKHGNEFVSLHEAYAVIEEEMDEVWDVCKQKKCERNRLELEHELVQVAAMAIKALQSMHNFTGGNV